MKVLVTRPANMAIALCQKINAMGAIAEPFPVIEFHPTAMPDVLGSAISHLNEADIAIFVSRTAVHFTMPLIQAQWQSLPALTFASVGPGTAETLRSYGIQEVLHPKEPPFETESLLSVKALQNVTGKQIIIFRGNGGRSLLSQTLKKRGASLQLIECYQRHLPSLDIVERLKNWRHNSIDVIVTTSAACLNNLILLIGSPSSWLKDIPIVVVGLRMLELANKLEFKSPILAAGADDTSIIKVLTEFKDNRV